MAIRNAFTVDVEDYYHVSAFEYQVERKDWGKFESRVERNVERLLELLAAHDVLGTFFVLGWVAEHHPQLVRRIHAAGHEIGSHSYWHRLIYRQTPEEFREDLIRSRDVLEETIGQKVRSFRAPSFSITRQSLWALDILAEEGFEFDSSVFPVYHDRYGIADARRDPHLVKTSAGSLWEFPLSVRRIAGVNFPVSGGGYFRMLPMRWTLHCLDKINCRQGRPFVFYIHPWELDPEQPRLEFGTRLSRFRHYRNLAATEQRLHRLLSAFEFRPLCEVIANIASQPCSQDRSAAHLASSI